MIRKDHAAVGGPDAGQLAELAQQLRSAVAGIRERKSELDAYLPRLRDRHVTAFRAHVRSLTELVQQARESLQQEAEHGPTDTRHAEEKLLLLSKAMDEMVERWRRSLRALEERVAQNGVKAEDRANQLEETLRRHVQELEVQVGGTVRSLEDLGSRSEVLQKESRSAEQRVATLEAQTADFRFRIQQLLVQSDRDRMQAQGARRWLWTCVAAMTVAVGWCLYIVW